MTEPDVFDRRRPDVFDRWPLITTFSYKNVKIFLNIFL